MGGGGIQIRSDAEKQKAAGSAEGYFKELVQTGCNVTWYLPPSQAVGCRCSQGSEVLLVAVWLALVVTCQSLGQILAHFLDSVVSQAGSRGAGKTRDTQAGKATYGVRDSLDDVPLATKLLQLMQLVTQPLIHRSAVSGRRAVSRTSCGGSGKWETSSQFHAPCWRLPGLATALL